jgi:hypothetical protein
MKYEPCSPSKGNGTSHHNTTVTATGAKLEKALGLVNSGDYGRKVTMQWTFQNADGRVFTLYDYKATSLYSKWLPDPEIHRMIVDEYHVGSLDGQGENQFAGWVRDRLRENR